MTLNDLIEAGITLQGKAKIFRYIEDERVEVYDDMLQDLDKKCWDKAWYDEYEITYIYLAEGDDAITIEISRPY